MQHISQYIAGLIILSLSLLGHANMGSPETAGTQAETGHFSQDIDILSEVIDIQILENLSSANYTVNYEVYSDKDREQVPLVFDVDDIEGKFQISVDNQRIDSIPVKHIQGMRHVYRDIRTPRVGSDIRGYRGKPSNDELSLEFEDSSYYFLIDLKEGAHNIRVNYTAIPDENRSDWTKRYSYHYALAPATLWKSFNNLTINVRVEDDIDTLDWTTNLGEPHSGKLSTTNEWQFADIPQEAIIIELQKRPSTFVQMLIDLNSWIVFLVSMGLFGFIHCWLIKSRLTANQPAIRLVKASETNTKVKAKNKTNYPRLIIWLGIFVVPFISLMLAVYRFDLIDALLGIHASRYHGYVGLILLFGYPIVLLGYLIYIKLIFIDRVQRKMRKKSEVS